jgi:hypothetical protein
MFSKAVRLAKQGGGASILPLTGFPGAGAVQQPIQSPTFQGPIRSHVPGRTDMHEMDVKGGSYVIPADAVSIRGQGNTEAGYNIIRLTMAHAPKGEHGVIRGASLPPLQLKGPVMKHAKTTSHGQHQAEGGVEEDHGGPVPIIAAGGEIVIPPEMIIHKFGSLDHGHKILDGWVKHVREQEIERLKNAPPPRK